ncbi:MAG: acyl-CoA dehydrogenase family protein [Solirubrobacteraceae bacterium]|nr:acyl-CoA dehydrogenase family protein [Solirubrobacteraceae bacterium]
MSDQLKSTPLDKATAVALRLVTKAGGLPVLQDAAMRKRVEKVLFVSTRQGLRTESVARKTFAKINTNGSKPARAKVAKPRAVFDLNPTEDQQMIQEAAGELAATVLRPAAQQADTDRQIPENVKDAAGELGLTLLGVPDELGGIAEERSAVTGVLVTEALAKGDVGLAAALLAPSAVASAIALYGDAGQQATYLPAFTEDEETAHAALAIQEPQPLFDPLEPKTKATKVGSDLKIDGVKALVANPEEAALFIVSALVEGEPRLVIIEAGTAGLSIEDDPAMGIRAARTGRLILDGVTVPAANLLGSTEDHLDAVRRGRLAWAAAAVGGAQAALDQLIPYVKERQAFGEPIAYRQAVAFTIADISIELEGLRLVVLRAAARLDAGKDASHQIAHARQLAATYATQIGSHAVQLLGGHGYVKEYPNERWYRDLRGVGVLEGTLLV